MAWPRQNNAHQYHNLKWVKQIKTLGIHFNSRVQAQNIDVNWESKTDNMKRTMKLWSRRNLSIYGKILRAKTFIMLQFIYTMQSVGIPDDILTKINRELFAFTWKKNHNNKKAVKKVKRKSSRTTSTKEGSK